MPGGSHLEFARPSELRELSLGIFDRSFAVTYALEAAAIAIGLFGLSSSLASQVLARRRGGREETVYRVGDLELDRLSHQVTRAGREIVLQPREFRLLEYLMKHAGQVVTRTMLLENVWDYHFDPQTNVIDVHISRLRSKIDKGFTQALLHTVRGAGYVVRDGR